MANSLAQYGTYKRVGIETASQGKLVIMLYNGAIQRAELGKRAIEEKNIQDAHNNLIRAQQIVTELRASLNLSVGEIAHNLNRIYEYLHHLLVRANVRKSVEPVDEFIKLMTDMRDTWQQVFEQHEREQPSLPTAPPMRPQGAGMVNIQG